MREFWRRWHVTSITWLRDYFAFPMAGRDAPTLRLFPSIVTGFALLGFWYGGGWTVAFWAAYSSAFLAFEAVGFGARISFWPRPIRHLYVLLVVTIGWVILRADSVAGAGNMLQVMTGLKGVRHLTVARYLTLEVVGRLDRRHRWCGPADPVAQSVASVGRCSNCSDGHDAHVAFAVCVAGLVTRMESADLSTT